MTDATDSFTSAKGLRLAAGGGASTRPARRLKPLPTGPNPKAEADAAEARALADLEATLGGEAMAEARVDAAKDTARLMGMQIARRIMALGEVSLGQLQERTGIDTATISRIANGRRASGPQLWTLLALADAAGLSLRIDVAKG